MIEYLLLWEDKFENTKGVLKTPKSKKDGKYNGHE